MRRRSFSRVALITRTIASRFRWLKWLIRSVMAVCIISFCWSRLRRVDERFRPADVILAEVKRLRFNVLSCCRVLRDDLWALRAVVSSKHGIKYLYDRKKRNFKPSKSVSSSSSSRSEVVFPCWVWSFPSRTTLPHRRSMTSRAASSTLWDFIWICLAAWLHKFYLQKTILSWFLSATYLCMLKKFFRRDCFIVRNITKWHSRYFIQHRIDSKGNQIICSI